MKYYIALLTLSGIHAGGGPSKISKMMLYEVSDGSVVSVHRNCVNKSDWQQYICNTCGIDSELVFKSNKSPFAYCSKHIVEYHPDLLESILTKHHKESGIGKIVSIELEHGDY